MTKTRNNKGGEKYDKTTDELGETGETVGKLATELNEASLCAASLCTELNPSTADLMRAITSLSKNVKTKFTAISDTMGAMQATLATVTGQVRDMEEVVNEHDDKLTSLENLCKNLQDGCVLTGIPVKTPELQNHRCP